MKLRIAFFLFLSCLCACASGIPTSKEILNRPMKPVSYTPAKPDRWTLSNGLTVFFMEDREIPLVRGTLMIPGGTLWEESDEYGSMSVMGSLMRTGGAGSLDADSLDRELEILSAKIGSGIGSEYGTVSFSGLSSDFDRVFELFSDIVLHPRYEEDRIQLWKGQAYEAIRRRTDDPDGLSNVALNQLLFGSSPYGRILVSSDVAKINRAQLIEQHRKLVVPRGAFLSIAGSIDRDTLRAAIEKRFGSWTGESNRLSPPEPPQSAEPGIYFLRFPLEQSTIMMGQQGVQRLTPDYPAIEVFNEAFGAGGFGSELVKKVRTELGLAYVVYGGIAPGVVRGRNFVGIQTKSQTAGEAIRESINVLETVQRDGIGEENVKFVKPSIENSFVFRFDSPDDLVQRAAILQLLKFPESYDDTYIGKIEAVMPSDVQEVARRRWDPSKWVIVVVGNDSARRSIEALLKDPPKSLSGMKIRDVSFNEQLIW